MKYLALLCLVSLLFASQNVNNKEVLVSQSLVYQLSSKDADIKTFSESYALYPKSKALKAFLISSVNPKAKSLQSLSSNESSLQIQSDDKQITFYHYSKRGSKLYDELANKSFALTKLELDTTRLNDESGEINEILEQVDLLDEIKTDLDSMPLKNTNKTFSKAQKIKQEKQTIYIIENYLPNIVLDSCQVILTKKFIRDRARSEMLINLDKQINPKLLSLSENEFKLSCKMPKKQEIFE